MRITTEFAAALLASMIDDGVRVLLIVNTCGIASTMVPFVIVIVSVRFSRVKIEFATSPE